MHQNCKDCKINQINQEVSDLTNTKFENVVPQFEHLNANETSAFEFFHHLKKTKNKNKTRQNKMHISIEISFPAFALNDKTD